MKKRRLLALLCALLLLLPAAHAELTAEDKDGWYEWMRYLTEEIGLRDLGSEGCEQAAAYILEAFEEMGYSEDAETLAELFVGERVVNDSYVAEVLDYEATLRAKTPDAPMVIVGAHYDAWDPGARDNASGVAAMLMLARRMAQDGPFENTEVRFVAFSAEEDAGHDGSTGYVDCLTEEERERVIAMFNLDIMTVSADAPEQVLSVDTLGMRTPDGYVSGSAECPADNRVSRAVRRAIEEMGCFDMAREGIDFCVPRHLGESDHEAFDEAEIDAGNVCFRGNVAEGGRWPAVMHTPQDNMDGLDIPRSHQALEVLYTAVRGVCLNHAYGD